MPNCVSYSLFGYADGRHPTCFDFKTYLRGLDINLRVAQLIYPKWKVFVALDEQTYKSPYREWFDWHKKSEFLDFVVMKKRPLCEMMLWRLYPVFSGYDRVICRDTDSLLSYKERLCTKYWEDGGRIVHAMTDSISHTIPLMGGMIGVMSAQFKRVIACDTFKEFIQLSRGEDFNIKGSDQIFLSREILPRIHQSITEHFLLGLPQSFRGDCHTTVPNIDLGLPEAYKETTSLSWHIGASGYQEPGTLKFLAEYGINNEHFEEIEKKFPGVFYWHL